MDWEAIKLTRGHYRSCGRDPAGCCVSDLLRDEPVVRSGPGSQLSVRKGHRALLGSVPQMSIGSLRKMIRSRKELPKHWPASKHDGVIVEGNSFLEYVKADLAIMCARSEGGKIKPSARRALARSDLLYLSTLEQTAAEAKRAIRSILLRIKPPFDLSRVRIITHEDMRAVLSQIYRAERQSQPVINLPRQATSGGGIQRTLAAPLYLGLQKIVEFVILREDAD